MLDEAAVKQGRGTSDLAQRRRRRRGRTTLSEGAKRELTSDTHMLHANAPRLPAEPAYYEVAFA